mmetsp:Transcript_18247/g.28790  ORF Transcript_18247/g.28790 Transcript_18247/m.28790 type:complete len:174 (-) Transcript_18247:486-1007(-)
MTNAWTRLVDNDEEIVWRGAPVPRVQVAWDSPLHPFFFLLFTGVSVFWMIMASQAPGFFWMFGLLFFFGVGFHSLALVHFSKAHERRNTSYTLTNKRAFIATKSAWKGKQLHSFAIGPDTPRGLSERAISTITFATPFKVVNRQTVQTPVRFEDIENGRDVYALFRQTQEQDA